MQRKGCKHLRIASILVILLGVISILAVQLLLGASEAETAAGLSESALKSALAGIVAIYAMNIFKIIAGLIGLVTRSPFLQSFWAGCFLSSSLPRSSRPEAVLWRL